LKEARNDLFNYKAIELKTWEESIKLHAHTSKSSDIKNYVANSFEYATKYYILQKEVILKAKDIGGPMAN